MLSSQLGNVLLRQVPEQLLTGVGSGELKVFGSIIRSIGTGRIVGHLQETSGLAKLAANAIAAPATLPLQSMGIAAGLVSKGVTVAQNEQTKAAVATIQHLQITTLVISAIGVGVRLLVLQLYRRRSRVLRTRLRHCHPTSRELLVKWSC